METFEQSQKKKKARLRLILAGAFVVVCVPFIAAMLAVSPAGGGLPAPVLWFSAAWLLVLTAAYFAATWGASHALDGLDAGERAMVEERGKALAFATPYFIEGGLLVINRGFRLQVVRLSDVTGIAFTRQESTLDMMVHTTLYMAGGKVIRFSFVEEDGDPAELAGAVGKEARFL
jgi:hypothetical protein